MNVRQRLQRRRLFRRRLNREGLNACNGCHVASYTMAERYPITNRTRRLIKRLFRWHWAPERIARRLHERSVAP